MYNSYGVKAGNTKGRTNAEAGNTASETDKGKKDDSLTSQSNDLQKVTQNSQLAVLATSSEKKAVATTSSSQDVVTEELYKQANKIIECRSEQWVNIWTECLEHFEKILSFCEKENRDEQLSEKEKETLSKAFEFIISYKTIFPLQEESVATVGPWGSIGLNVSDELVTTYESLYKICLSAATEESIPEWIFNTLTLRKGRPKLDNNAFVQNAYKVFQSRMGKSMIDKNSIWNLTYKSQLILSNRILLLQKRGTIALNPLTMRIQSIMDTISESATEVFGKLLMGVNSSIQNTGNCLANGGMEAITEPVVNKFEGALKNAATTSLDYAKITALQTGAGLAGIFVTAKLVCNLIPKILSDSNNRNKQKQAVAENREQPHKVENQ